METSLDLLQQAQATPAFRGVLAFCSIMYPATVFGYPSVANAVAAAKTLDPYLRRAIRNEPNPYAAKRMGDSLDARPDWGDIELHVMETLEREKFTHNADLAAQLINTGDVELVNRNYVGDTFWGVCNGKGENHSGRILTLIRSELQAVALALPASVEPLIAAVPAYEEGLLAAA
jgi:N-glycosidase YbiA